MQQPELYVLSLCSLNLDHTYLYYGVIILGATYLTVNIEIHFHFVCERIATSTGGASRGPTWAMAPPAK
jgi:hypothetical protein